MHSIMARNSTKLYWTMKNISFYHFSHMKNNSYYEVLHNPQEQLDPLYKDYLITGNIIFIAGAFLSLWFLVAILHSQKVRSRLRNKIICNTFLLILLDCLLVEPWVNITTWRLVHSHMYTWENITMWPLVDDHCYTSIHTLVIVHLGEIQDFMENWILVMLLAIFFAQVKYVHPSGTFSQRTITVATSALLVLPWIVSLTVVPVALYVIEIMVGFGYYCLHVSSALMAIYTCIDTAIPLCLSLTLVIITALMRHRRFSRGNSTDGVSTEFIRSGVETEIDPAYVYGIAVVVSIVCDFPYMIGFIIETDYEHLTHNYIEWYHFQLISATMTKLRVVLLPLVWLLFPDIRQQIKTWRPWRRPPLGTDMTVTYRREECV